MGIRVPIEHYPYGVPCWCHPKPVLTPEIIYAYFWEMVQCPGKLVPPNMHVFPCYQDVVDPCTWYNVPGAYGWKVEIFYMCGQNQTEILLRDLSDNRYFDSVLNEFPNEHTVFNNIFTGCAFNQFAFDGGAFLFWNEALLDLINNMNLPNEGHTFMEIFRTDNDKPVYKLCNIKYGLNQKFLIEP